MPSEIIMNHQSLILSAAPIIKRRPVLFEGNARLWKLSDVFEGGFTTPATCRHLQYESHQALKSTRLMVGEEMGLGLGFVQRSKQEEKTIYHLVMTNIAMENHHAINRFNR